ncbi:MAG: hypothetical protein A2104_04430 [Candidatus Melainabacteria bacterium GWF2_32_7]|nr:MAG: hypothetical protein A2104_04430 [Candidatus Melainabacteria bacterium GWF2_32_7]
MQVNKPCLSFGTKFSIRNDDTIKKGLQVLNLEELREIEVGMNEANSILEKNGKNDELILSYEALNLPTFTLKNDIGEDSCPADCISAKTFKEKILKGYKKLDEVLIERQKMAEESRIMREKEEARRNEKSNILKSIIEKFSNNNN